MLPGITISPQRRAEDWLRRSTPGRILLAGLVLKIVDIAASAALGSPRPAWVDVVDTCGTLGIIFGFGYLLARGLGWMRRRLLWRVRRKLILSYVFVGLVPSLLIVTFFVLAGLLLIRNVAGYMVQTRLEAQAAQARFLAQTVLLDVQRATSAEAVRETLERQQATASARYPFLSIALVPVRGVTCPPGLLAANAGRTPPVLLPIRAGEWAHVPAPAALPSWLTACDAPRAAPTCASWPAPSRCRPRARRRGRSCSICRSRPWSSDACRTKPASSSARSACCSPLTRRESRRAAPRSTRGPCPTTARGSSTRCCGAGSCSCSTLTG
jgi:hypothetical protein